MYELVRVLICLSLLLLFIFLYRKRLTKRLLIIFIVLTVILSLILNYCPIENLFYSFSSPEAAYQYMYGKQAEIFTVSGEKSTLILGDKNTMISPKMQNGWKLATAFSVKLVETYGSQTATVFLTRLSGTNEYYIIISMIYQGPSFQLTDRDNSEFFAPENVTEQSTHVPYYAYVPKVDQDYYFYIHNRPVYPFRDIKF